MTFSPTPFASRTYSAVRLNNTESSPLALRIYPPEPFEARLPAALAMYYFANHKRRDSCIITLTIAVCVSSICSKSARTLFTDAPSPFFSESRPWSAFNFASVSIASLSKAPYSFAVLCFWPILSPLLPKVSLSELSVHLLTTASGASSCPAERAKTSRSSVGIAIDK